MLIGKRIKELRIEKNMSQQELGELLGITKVSVCGYENGTRTPNLETFTAIADIFGTTTDYLLGREIPVVNEISNEYVGSVSKEDIELIQEMRHYPNLYSKMQKDVKRFMSIVNKKMK